MTTESTKETVKALIEQYSGDDTFWRFVDDFAATVELDLKSGHFERIANLLGEGARRYEWLREFEPNHFARLKETDPEKLKMLVAVVDWAIIENLPVSHYSRSGNREPSMFAAFVASRLAADNKAKLIEFSDPINFVYDHIPMPTSTIWQTAATSVPSVLAEASPVTPTPISDDDLKAASVKAYEDALGKVIKVKHYAVPTGENYYPAIDTTVLAVVVETSPSEIGIREDYEGNEISMRSTWSVRLMTGEHRGETGFVHSPTFHSDSHFDPQWVETTGSTIADYARAWLSEADLVLLLRLDCEELQGKTVSANWVQAYIGDTNQMGEFSFDPPFEATVDAFNFERFHDQYRIDNGDDNGDLVIDMYIDLSTADERLSNLRGSWCDAAAYHTNGRIEPNNGIVSVLDQELEISGPKI
jgi:hypothetical protein